VSDLLGPRVGNRAHPTRWCGVLGCVLVIACGHAPREVAVTPQPAAARIDYLDYHMGTATGDPDLRAIVEQLGSEYGLGLMGYYGDERFNPQYWAEPEAKLDSLLAAVGRLEPGYHVLVTHVGIDTPELAALVDMNTGQPLENMSRHRQGELDALMAPAFREAVVNKGVTLMTYRGLLGIVRPAGRPSPRP
jgi:YdjC-like protein